MEITWVEEFVQEVFVHFLKVDGKETINGVRFQVVEVSESAFELYEIHDVNDTWEFTTFTTLAEAKLAAEKAASGPGRSEGTMDTSDMWDYSKMTRNELANKASEIRLKIATLEDEIVALEMHRDVLKDELEKVSAAGEKE